MEVYSHNVHMIEIESIGAIDTNPTTKKNFAERTKITANLV